MKTQVKTHFLAILIAALAALVTGASAAPQAYADDPAASKLEVVGTPTVNVVTGGTADLQVKVRNTTSETVDYISIWDSTVVGEGDDAFTPYTFQDKRKSPEPENAKVTHTMDATYYGVEPGQTATFHVLVQSYDLEPGTYDHFIQLANWEWVADEWNEWGWPTHQTKTLYDLYSEPIPVRITVYNPPDAALSVGTSSNYGFEVSPFPSAGIDFGTIDLASASEEDLNKAVPFFIKNVSPTVDTNVGTRPDITLVDGTSLVGPQGTYSSSTPFSYHNGYGLWSYDTILGQDGSHSVELSVDGSYFIAGTYTADVSIETVPHKVKINGVEGDNSGSYTVPATVTFTGQNPRLPKAATNMQATPGNALVELAWEPSEDDGDASRTYYVYRRTGKETKTDPDTWTLEDWNCYEKLNINPVTAKGDDTYLYIDGTVENGTEYSYVVTTGDPFRCYATPPVSATPDASLTSRLQAPENVAADDGTDGITLTWHMSESYGGTDNDGAGMVDHFNIYRDGTLVKQVYQSAVNDDVTMGWVDQGNGTSSYGINGHSFSWETHVDAPEVGQNYTFNVACVAMDGTVGYWSEGAPGMSLPEVGQIVGQEITFYGDDSFYDEETGNDITALVISVKLLEDGSNTDSLTFWRSEGTAAPDTNSTPYSTCDKNYTTGWGEYDLADTDVEAGKTYTYTVQARDTRGRKSDFYTFTAVAQDDASLSSTEVDWRVIDGRKASMTWSSDYRYSDEGDLVYTGTYLVYRNDALVATLTDPVEGAYSYEDDPGTDGTYTYRMDKRCQVAGVTHTLPGHTYTFVRSTAAADESQFLKPPSAPTLTARVSDGHPILNWTAGTGGGAPQGYHIYRTDAGAPVLGGRYVRTWHWNGYTNDYVSWGNARYLTIQDSTTDSFVDGCGGNYQGDRSLGTLQNISWYEDSCPHAYWVTAYNDAGESAPSQVLSFGFAGLDENENPRTPTSDAVSAPTAPTISKLWVEWQDDSSKSTAFDTAIGGHVRVAWEDDESPENTIDLWNIYTSGTSGSNHATNQPAHDELSYSEAMNDPALKRGAADFSWAYLDARTGEYGDLNSTVTITVQAVNSMGTASSEAKSIVVRSLPRFRAIAENAGARLEWTDLFNDADTQVSAWEVWRRQEHGVWEKVTTLGGDIPYAGTDQANSYGPETSYYAWNDTELDNGWSYEYRIVAKCADGIDRPSVVRKVEPKPTATSEAPGAPVNLRAQILNGEVLFTWDPPEAGGTPKYYQLMQKSPETGGTEPSWKSCSSSIPAPSTSCVWAPSTAGTFEFLVYAYNYLDGQQVPRPLANPWDTNDEDLLYPSHSEIVSVTITDEQIGQQTSDNLAKPILTASPGENQITLSWTLAKDGARPTYFEIERYADLEWYASSDINFDTKTILATGTSWSFVDTTAEPGMRYRYKVTSRVQSHSGSNYADIYAMAEGKTRDEIVAERVGALIEGLPDPAAVSVDDADTIAEVNQAFSGLTRDQRSLVDERLRQKLSDCIDAVEELRLVEQYADVAAPVQVLIDALPDASAITHETIETYAPQVEDARAAYDALMPAAAKRIVKTSRLVEAEERITELREEAEDLISISPVIERIEALPDAAAIREEGIDDLDSATQDARAAYEALTAKQQSRMAEMSEGAAALTKLAEVEERIEQVKAEVADRERADQEAAEAVTALIMGLKEPALIRPEDADAIRTAREAYDALTDAQKERVDAEAKERLTEAEARIAAFEEAAAVSQLIASLSVIDIIETDPSDAEALAAARAAYDAAQTAYDALSDDAKGLITAAELTKLEAAGQALGIQESARADRQAAAVVTSQIETTAAIRERAEELSTLLSGSDELTDEQLASIQQELADMEQQLSAITTAYTSLTPEQKALVEGIDDLVAAEHALGSALARAAERGIEDATELEQMRQADQAAADTVVASIDQLPDLEQVDPADTEAMDAAESAIAAARAAYDALNMPQKALVTNSSSLTDAERLIGQLYANRQESALERIAQQERDARAAGEVTDLIANLPSVGELTLDDEGKVIAARTAYEQLTDSQKDLVGQGAVDELVCLEERISELRQGQEASKNSLDQAVVSLSETSFTYDGSEHKPSVTVRLDDTPLVEGVDYELTFANCTNAGTATATVTGKGEYTGSTTATYVIAPQAATPEVTLAATSYTYDGQVKTPAIGSVKVGSVTLVEGTGYIVTHATGRKDVGRYNVEVKLSGNYRGSKTVSFDINPKGTRLAKLKKARKSAIITWKKQAKKMATARINGYQIQVSTSAKFSTGVKTVTVAGYAKTSKKVSRLKGGKRYYVRIRTYKTISGVKYYSPWSRKKSVVPIN